MLVDESLKQIFSKPKESKNVSINDYYMVLDNLEVMTTLLFWIADEFCDVSITT